MTLRDVRRSGAFASVREFDESARFHVWHRRLGVEECADDSAVEALARGRGLAVIGSPGSGKTSTLAASALGSDDFAARHVPLPLSVSGAQVADLAHDPRFLAARVVRAVARINDEAKELTDEASAHGSASRTAVTWKQQVGVRGVVRFAREVRQRTENVTFERTPDEVLEVAAAATRLLRENGIRPVILLEDADGLLRIPGRSDADRYEIANAFFADGLAPLIRTVGAPVLVAVQPEYPQLEGFRALSPFLDGVVPVPRPPQLSEAGVHLLLGESLRAAGVHTSLKELFDEDALAVVVANRYSMNTIRELLEVCDRSLLHAMNARQERIAEGDVAYALTQGTV